MILNGKEYRPLATIHEADGSSIYIPFVGKLEEGDLILRPVPEEIQLKVGDRVTFKSYDSLEERVRYVLFVDKDELDRQRVFHNSGWDYASSIKKIARPTFESKKNYIDATWQVLK